MTEHARQATPNELYVNEFNTSRHYWVYRATKQEALDDASRSCSRVAVRYVEETAIQQAIDSATAELRAIIDELKEERNILQCFAEAMSVARQAALKGNFRRLLRNLRRSHEREIIPCPNCGRPITRSELVIHDSECELCDGELDVTHCGCYYDEPKP